MIKKNEKAKTTYYHETIQRQSENDSKEILSIYILCFLSISIVHAVFTIIINTTVTDFRKT